MPWSIKRPVPGPSAPNVGPSPCANDLGSFLKKKDAEFVETLLDYIHKGGHKSATIYNSIFDLIIPYYIEHKCYNVVQINITLYEFDPTLLGA